MVALGAGGAYLIERSSGDAGAAVPTIELGVERFTRRITAEGNLRAVDATPVTPPRPNGRPRPMKIAWLAPDGSNVAVGEVVLRFDASELEKQLKDGQADLAAAQAKLARERVQAGTAEDNRESAAALAELELAQTRRFQPKDSEIFSRQQIIESRIDEGLSQAKKDHARSAEKLEKRLTRAKIAVLEVDRKKAELAIQQARAGLEQLEIKAPHAGILVYQRDWRGNLPREGDQIWPGQTVAEIPILSEMEAQVFVLEVDGGGLRAGVVAHVTIEAHPAESFAAVVKRVDNLAQPRIRDQPIQYFAVTLTLERTDAEVMKPGQRVRATLILDHDEALFVPRHAVVDRDDKNLVYRLDGDRFVPVEVVLGAATAGRVIIENGLAAGDRIALGDPTRSREPAEAADGATTGESGHSP